MDINNIKVSFNQVYDTYCRLGVNEALHEYYMRMHDEKQPPPDDFVKLDEYYSELQKMTGKDYLKGLNSYKKAKENICKSQKFERLAERVKFCNSCWFFDTYHGQKIKDLKSVNLCGNKFCSNCQKLLQASRLYRFSPEIEKISETTTLYHAIFTVPNCIDSSLKNTINKMFAAFKRIIAYLKLDTKIAGIDFSRYQYLGAIRALEVTYTKTDYHPHLHCIFSFDYAACQDKTITNKYSYSYNKLAGRWVHTNYFSEFEILLQKILYLLMNNIKVTKQAIDSLELGYDVLFLEIDGDSPYEVFKYAFKTTNDQREFMTYAQFKTLYYALYKKRTVQGYGCFYNITGGDDIEDGVAIAYNQLIEELKSVETPENEYYTVPGLLEEMSRRNFIIISRKNIQRYLIEINKREREELEKENTEKAAQADSSTEQTEAFFTEENKPK